VYDIPEQAIGAFEKIHGLNVTVHDLRGSLWAFLAPDRFHHVSPLCEAVKAKCGQAPCLNDSCQIRLEFPERPDGFAHKCHAGIVEWTVPVFYGVELEWVLYAGPRMPSSSLIKVIVAPPSDWRASDWPACETLPRPVDDKESELILEHLRQLASRLSAWRDAVEAFHSDGLPARHATTPGLDPVAHRRVLVRRFIAMRHTEPVMLADLARALCLSESRASHAVQECCGATFHELLRESRLRTAMGLLTHTSLSVFEVAMRSGFRDPGTFHRLFRRATGASPGRYRKVAGP
jgi:AraC-like DNA-binding protein